MQICQHPLFEWKKKFFPKGHIQFTFGLDKMSIYIRYLPLGFRR